VSFRLRSISAFAEGFCLGASPNPPKLVDRLEDAVLLFDCGALKPSETIGHDFADLSVLAAADLLTVSLIDCY